MNRQITLHIARFAILALLVTLFGSCRRAPLSPRLTVINTLAETAPLAALDSLRAINPDTLSDRDRNYYDFLTVKCERKAYLPIESDSLILKVIDYASSHEKDGYYPEALYTGGLAYAALGDQPTALEYFHKAEDLLPEGDSNLHLKSKILSQTGRLFFNLRLDDEAESYILKAIETGKILKDTVNLILDYQLLARHYQRTERYDKADSLLSEALMTGGTLSPEINSGSYLYLALGNAQRGKYNLAIINLRQSLNSIPKHSKNIALAHAAQIYRQAGIADTAYIIAEALVHSENPQGKSSAFEVLLNPELRKFIPEDSLDAYYSEYAHLLRSYYDQNASEMVIHQQSAYNYNLQREKRFVAETQVYQLWILIGWLLFMIAGAIGVILYFRDKAKNSELSLYHAMDVINNLSAKNTPISNLTTNNSSESPHIDHNASENTSDSVLETIVPSKTALREKMRERLLNLLETTPSPTIDSRIINSEVYQKFVDAASACKLIPERAKEWSDLENLVLLVSPDFKSALEVLFGGKVKPIAFQTALLIKCGFRHIQMAYIFGRDKSSVTRRVKSLSVKIFGEDSKNAEKIELLIRLI